MKHQFLKPQIVLNPKISPRSEGQNFRDRTGPAWDVVVIRWARFCILELYRKTGRDYRL
ncbi:MAG: hypothetical protein VKK80_01615 [Prochlorothrix sp.]|nr:hypothetical protein [Prochlorothrix sp.]